VPPTLPNGFVGQKSILRQMVLAANTLTAWGTPFVTPATAFSEALRYDVAGFVKFAQKKESTYGTAGATNSFANDNWLITKETSLDISGQLTDWLAGYLLTMALGKEVVTGVGAPYTHTINFYDTGNIAQGTSIYAKDTNDVAYQLLDMGISQLTITSSGTGSLKFKATLLGTGRVVDGIVAGLPTPVTRQHLLGSDTNVSIGPSGGGLVSYYPRVKSWELTIDCSLAVERVSGSGLYGSHLTVAMPKVKFKMVVASNGTDDIYAWKRANTMLAMTVNTTSSGSSLNLSFPNFTLDENCSLGDLSGASAWTIDLGETDILQIGNTPLITAVVINSQASYLTAA
jgi:Phage tail tube protein